LMDNIASFGDFLGLCLFFFSHFIRVYNPWYG